jgi:hypothetical protein
MTTFVNSPKLLKGGLVLIDLETSAVKPGGIETELMNTRLQRQGRSTTYAMKSFFICAPMAYSKAGSPVAIRPSLVENSPNDRNRNSAFNGKLFRLPSRKRSGVRDDRLLPSFTESTAYRANLSDPQIRVFFERGSAMASAKQRCTSDAMKSAGPRMHRLFTVRREIINCR